MAYAWIGLGSNLNNPLEHLQAAFTELNELTATRCLKQSSVWRSKPLGPQNQPDFLNAVALLETQLQPLQLLDQLQWLEQQHQRVRLETWGPRTLDLDLLLYDQLVMQHPRLQIPHSQMHLRSFVLKPLAELASELCLPNHGKISDLLMQLEATEPEDQVLPLEAAAAVTN